MKFLKTWLLKNAVLSENIEYVEAWVSAGANVNAKATRDGKKMTLLAYTKDRNSWAKSFFESEGGSLQQLERIAYRSQVGANAVKGYAKETSSRLDKAKMIIGRTARIIEILEKAGAK